MLGPDVGVLGAIFVDKSLRRKGLGSVLLKASEEELKKNGSSQIFLDCWSSRDNVTFYESQGYMPIIKLGPAYHDGSALIVMGKEL